MTTRPDEINLNRAGGYLEIKWKDGRICQYSLPHLREACPCAVCRGGHENMGLAHAPDDLLSLSPEREYVAERVEVVGNYALQFFWDDGHHAGIYTWDYLYLLCPK